MLEKGLVLRLVLESVRELEVALVLQWVLE